MRPKPNRVVRHRWLWRCIWSLIVLSGLGAVVLQAPSYLYGFGLVDDDELMVQMARGFLNGHWSSNWKSTGVVTITKPAGYPLFLAGAHYLPWTPIISTYLLYLLGAVLIAWSWQRIRRSPVQTTIILALLTLNPVYFSTLSLRVYRDGFIDSLATLAVGLTFVVVARLRPLGAQVGQNSTLEARPTRPSHRRSSKLSSSRVMRILRRSVPFLLAILIGLVVGLSAITKPTWQWLLFALAAPVAYPLGQRLRRIYLNWRTILRVILATLMVVVSAFAVVEFDKTMNQRTYHVSLEEDLSSGALARAWKLWASVEAGPPEKYIAITKAMRMAVYRVSPTAAQLKPYLESPKDYWRTQECATHLRICYNSGAWFEWDLRYASVATGHVRSVLGFQTFFNKVADDISTACRSGALRCSSSPVLATVLPTLNQIPRRDIFSYTTGGLWQMAQNQLPVGPVISSRPTAAEYRLWKSVIPGMPALDKLQSSSTPGWLFSPLRVWVKAYGVLNLLLLALIVIGPMRYLVERLLRARRPRRRMDWRAASTSTLFFIATLVGMTTLAVFAAAVGGLGFTSAVYWIDFGTPAELFLVFGAYAAWPVVISKWTRRPSVAPIAQPTDPPVTDRESLAASGAPLPR